MRHARLALASAALLFAACTPAADPDAYTKVPIQPFLGKPVLGDSNAPVELAEYASTTCGHCKAFHDEIFPELKARYIDTGKVKLAWYVLPTAPAPLSLAGAAIARCAGEDRFFGAIDTLFDQQEALFNAASPADMKKQLNDIGAKFDLSPDATATCIDDPAIQQATNAALADMPQTITGTPSFVINGVKIEPESLEGLSAAIEAELAKAAAPADPATPAEPGAPATPPQ
jgi:protein-disulfide isomerase